MQLFGTLYTPLKTYVIFPAIGILFGVAMIYFLWGMVVFIWSSSNEEGRQKGKEHMMYGVLGLAIMLSVYGIMNFILATIRSIGPGLHYDANGIRQDRPVENPSTLMDLEGSNK